MSCPQIWNIQQEKDREKEEVGGRPSKLNEKRATVVGRTTWKFCSGGDKMRNVSGHQYMQGKNECSEKKVKEYTYDISSIKRLTKR